MSKLPHLFFIRELMLRDGNQRHRRFLPVSYEDFVAAGSLAGAREKGLSSLLPLRREKNGNERKSAKAERKRGRLWIGITKASPIGKPLLALLKHECILLFSGVEASVEGVLGGYGCVNDVDVKCSEAFLKTILPLRFGKEKRHLVALDCGLGIGRVTKNLLLRHFNEVDLVEPVSHFLEMARENLSQNSDNNMRGEEESHKASNFFCIPLQEFTPEACRYDVIWIQRCIGHLTDQDFISFFKRAKVGLKPNGFFIVKENIARTGLVRF
ncbi:hypothetical protein LUZ60_010363 [Juncus effusus]|nr:hypothetical protein LUZ60_010363 [Juncus effusus]